MAEPTARLLVTVPPSADLVRSLASRLPAVAVAWAGPDAQETWPNVEAWLVGTLQRELPGWTPDLTPSLRFVQRIFTGLDDFPFGRFPDSVTVAGNGGAYAPYVAEHAIALLLALTHNLRANHERVRSGSLRPPLGNRFLVGRTAVLLGFGSIAREVALRLRPFGVRIEAVTRRGDPDPAADRTYSADRLLDALAAADMIVETRPLTRATRRTLDRRAFGAMRPEAIFVNVGRAGTVDEAALFEHLKATPTFQCGTDVFWREEFGEGRLALDHPFVDLPNFLGTPHVAGVGAGARTRAELRAVDNLVRFFAGETPLYVADRTEYEVDAG